MTPSGTASESLPLLPPGTPIQMGGHSESEGATHSDIWQHASSGSSSKPESEHSNTGVYRLLKSKESVVKVLSDRSGKLTLLKLPVDILRLIVQEVPHTNDLASLALANSTLHSLAVPHIYSRFDIVWPDSQSAVSDTKNVDALTYGLSTLVLGNKFAHHINKLRSLNKATAIQCTRQFRVDHDYARYTKKFSVGNGPDDWVSEYHIFKEGGKMLGILVALAIERMVNLETFIWDMPTGVISDVFLALASPLDGMPNDECKLDRVWIRLHDSSFLQEPASNSHRTSAFHHGAPEGTTLTAIGLLPPHPHTHPEPAAPIAYRDSNVEYPTFSILPPLRSLTVLEIDDLSYLDELSMLIERSQHRLHELRVGISRRAARLDFAQAWDGPSLQQVDKSAHWPGASKIGSRRLGGVLGVLLGRIFDLRRKSAGTTHHQNSTLVVTVPIPSGSSTPGPASQASPHQNINGAATSLDPRGSPTTVDSSPRSNSRTDALVGRKSDDAHQRLEGKLRLRVLELERVPLSIQVLLKAFDWTTLTTLTLIDCPHQMTLWKMLARQFLPTSNIPGLKGPSAIRHAPPSSLQYHLALKHIHTDTMGPSLIKFIKETLAPNTLETLLLHDNHRVPSPRVTLQKIIQLAVARHCNSLRRLLLDSSDGSTNPHMVPENTRWLHWTPTTDMVLYLTSGKLSQLKELSISLSSSDWHILLRRLPNIPHLRALDIPHISGRDRLGSIRELAQQIVDIVTLRPEIQLCYVGLLKECYEILEAEPVSRSSGAAGGSASDANGLAGSNAPSLTNDDDETASNGSGFSDGDDDDDDDDDGSANDGVPGAIDSLDSESEAESAWASDGESLGAMDFEASSREFQARQILFYDEITIFRARRAKL